MIVLEGPDASGKTTLANYLSNALGVAVQHSEGPPQHANEMGERLERYAQLPVDTIFDRHPCVSEEMYSYALRRPIAVTAHQVGDFYRRKPFLIYCEPPLSAQVEHIIKPHDTAKHLLAVHENYDRLLCAYHAWAASHAHIIYRIGDDMPRVLHYVTDFVGDIHNFHKKFDIAYDGPPRNLPDDLWRFRLSFLAEELCEYAGLPDVTTKLIQAAVLGECAPPPLCDQFDALIDLIYVTLGTAHLQGFKFTEGWARVHRANMTKHRAKKAADSKRSHIADVIKPSGWVAPDLSTLVRET